MRRYAAGVRVATLVTVLAAVLVSAPGAGAGSGDITEWPTVDPGSSPLGIAAAPDGALWFAERGADRIGRITTLGVVSEIQLPNGAGPSAIAGGADGAMWFTEQAADAIGRVQMDGNVSEFPLTGGARPTGIALGLDQAMWFTEREANRIGRIALDGMVTEYQIPSSSSRPNDITLGPDGALWFTEMRTGRIGRIAPDGTISEYPVPGGSLPTGIVAGLDGALWFTAPGSNAIGRMTTAGTVSMLPIPTASSNPTGIAVGPDGAIWFTEQSAGAVARIDTDGTITEYAPPTDWSGPHGLAAGPDGNLWFAEASASAVARLELTGPDTEAPTVDLRTPAHGGAYLVGQAVTAAYTCADTGGSGLASCLGVVPDGGYLDTSSPGIRHFEVTAVDGADNTTTVVHDYVVFASWHGRLRLPPETATLRAGQPVDLRFGLGGDLGEILEPGAPYVELVHCGSGLSMAATWSATSVGRGLRVVNGEYRFHWRTDRAWAGGCYALVLPFTIQGGATVRLVARFV